VNYVSVSVKIKFYTDICAPAERISSSGLQVDLAEVIVDSSSNL
jgi:hypothetical protein